LFSKTITVQINQLVLKISDHHQSWGYEDTPEGGEATSAGAR
jgi:hypothetical protein